MKKGSILKTISIPKVSLPESAPMAKTGNVKILSQESSNNSPLPTKLGVQTQPIGTRILNFLSKVVKYLSKLVWICIVLIVLANFAPELREQLPSLYHFVDIILKCFESLALKVLELLNI